MTYAIIEATRHVLVAAIPIILIKTGNLFNHTTGEKKTYQGNCFCHIHAIVYLFIHLDRG